jgi:hypothetical protein
VKSPARVARQPGQYLGMLMGGVVVEHGVDQLTGGNRTLDGIEETDEFAVAVALHAAPDHRAVEHAERGEQGGGAVPFVIVRHGLAAPGLDRQSGLGAVERLDLALLVEREHHRMGRRIDTEPDDIDQLGGKASDRAGAWKCPAGAAAVCAHARCAANRTSEVSMALAIDRPVQWVA